MKDTYVYSSTSIKAFKILFLIKNYYNAKGYKFIYFNEKRGPCNVDEDYLKKKISKDDEGVPY